MTQPYGQEPPAGQQPPGAGYGQPAQPVYVAPPPRGSRFNVAAAVLAIIAAILGILAVTVLAWYRKNFGSVSGGAKSSDSKFGKVHDALTQAQHSVDTTPGASKVIHIGAISPTYFSWLGYVLLAAAVVLLLIAAAPLRGASTAIRILAALVALAGLGLTIWAVDLVNFDSSIAGQLPKDTPKNFGDWITHTSFGAWAMALAFLLCFIGALIPGPRAKVATAAY